MVHVLRSQILSNRICSCEHMNSKFLEQFFNLFYLIVLLNPQLNFHDTLNLRLKIHERKYNFNLFNCKPLQFLVTVNFYSSIIVKLACITGLERKTFLIKRNCPKCWWEDAFFKIVSNISFAKYVQCDFFLV